MKKLRLLSLCSGIGGADLAAESTGAIEVVGQVEIDPFCQAVLAKHWPHVPRMHDIKEVQGDEFGQVDILAAGIPCQGNSHAGKRKGSQDERNLWPETRRIIGRAHPRWIVVENVPGLLTVESGRLFSTILTDLVTLRYRVGWAVYGACEVGAPHRRRLWTDEPQCQSTCSETPDAGADGTQGIMADADSGQRQWRAQLQAKRGQVPGERDLWPDPDGCGDVLADAACLGQRAWRPELPGQQGALQPDRGRTPLADADGARRSLSAPVQDTTEQITGRSGESVSDTDAAGLPGSGKQRGLRAQAGESPAVLERGDCPQPVWSGSGTIESGVCRGADGVPAWMDGHRWPALPGQQQEAWEPSRTISGRQPFRNQRLKALGNAIVPQQIYPLFSAIAAWEGRIPA